MGIMGEVVAVVCVEMVPEMKVPLHQNGSNGHNDNGVAAGTNGYSAGNSGSGSGSGSGRQIVAIHKTTTTSTT
ncbi:unnamed protein product [Sphagnum jensenii]|jgi:hypothetical protein